MTMPSLETARQILAEAEGRNPGPWVQHSKYVAQAAREIAEAHPALDPERAYILGLLHDIGRREGVTNMRHVTDGYHYLMSLGYTEAARASLLHSFPIKDAGAGAGKWDAPEEDVNFVRKYLAHVEFDDYDRLIQLCDSLALPSGYTLIEKRLVDVALRYGFNGCTIEKWKAILKIQEDFEHVIGKSIYMLLPGVVENTFGFDA